MDVLQDTTSVCDPYKHWDLFALVISLTVLIEGVLFRARYLGSTQLISEGQPSKAVRMMQAQEAISRIKVCYIDICIFICNRPFSGNVFVFFLSCLGKY